MNYENFTEEEISRLKTAGFDISIDCIANHHDLDDLKVIKNNGVLYVEMEECEGGEFENNGRIYQLGRLWWMPFDLDNFISEEAWRYPEDFYPEEYELNS